VGTDVLTADPPLPFYLTWDVPPALHPAADGPDDVRIAALTMAGAANDADADTGGAIPDDRQRLAAWLDGELGSDPTDRDPVRIEWVEPRVAAGLVGVVVRTRSGSVHLT
jgi:hypothetical protein